MRHLIPGYLIPGSSRSPLSRSRAIDCSSDISRKLPKKARRNHSARLKPASLDRHYPVPYTDSVATDAEHGSSAHSANICADITPLWRVLWRNDPSVQSRNTLHELFGRVV